MTENLVYGKGKIYTRTCNEDAEAEKRYSSTLSLTLALDGVGGQRHVPTVLLSRKRPGNHYAWRWVGPTADVELVQEISPPPGFEPRTVQPVASRHTDWAIPAHNNLCPVCMLLGPVP